MHCQVIVASQMNSDRGYLSKDIKSYEEVKPYHERRWMEGGG
jgi:hypothetical protein